MNCGMCGLGVRWQQNPVWIHVLLVRRSLKEPDDVTYYVVFARAETNPKDWLGVAGRRWTIEETFEQ